MPRHPIGRCLAALGLGTLVLTLGDVVKTVTCDDVMMDTMTSQITSPTIVYSAVYSAADQRKHQSSASLAFVRGIHRGPVNSPHKGPVTRKMFHHVKFHVQSLSSCITFPGIWLRNIHNERKLRTSVPGVNWFKTMQYSYLVFKLDRETYWNSSSRLATKTRFLCIICCYLNRWLVVNSTTTF